MIRMNARTCRTALVVLLLGTAGAVAQHKGSGSGSGTSAPASGYAGFEKRQVASFSDDDVKAMLDGRGMGFALPAEINGYPGPMHVLQLADELGLTTEQRSAMQQLFERMRVRAQQAAARYVTAEQAVDQAFRSGKADVVTIANLVRDADQRRADTRLAHLETHLEAAPLLTAEQLAKYVTLRGYGTKTP